MADAHAKPHHDYHLVDPSPWPAIGSVSAFVTGGRRRSPGCITCSRRRRFIFGVGADRRALHHVRLVARRGA